MEMEFMSVIKERGIGISHLARKMEVKRTTLYSWLTSARTMPEWAEKKLRGELGL